MLLICLPEKCFIVVCQYMMTMASSTKPLLTKMLPLFLLYHPNFMTKPKSDLFVYFAVFECVTLLMLWPFFHNMSIFIIF